MLLLLFLCTCTALSSVIIIIYLKLIRPAKRLYDEFRRQGVSCEPFVPILGQLPQLYRYAKKDRFLNFYEDLMEKHGPVFAYGLGPLTRLFVQEPQILAEILGRPHAQDYTKPPDFATIFKPILGSHNLLVSEGVEHSRARNMITPAFHFVNLKSMISIMSDQTAKAIDNLIESSSITQQTVDLAGQFNALTLSIIASSAFGESFETIANAKEVVRRVATEVLEAVTYRTIHMINQVPFLARLPFWRKHIVDNGSRDVGHVVDQVIARRRNGQSTSVCAGADLLDLLLSAVDAEGQPFTDEEIKQQALTFVLAGHETTSNLMTWAIYALMTNNDVLCACQEEVDRVLPNGIHPTYEHLSDLVICEAVLQETLRLYPPVPFFTRQCTHEHTVSRADQSPLRIQTDTVIVVCNYLLHRRPEYWSRPLEFDYTRWLRDPVTGLKPKLAHPFCYLPFAAGPRNCIGQNFAMLEGKVMLAMFLQRCRFDIEPGQNITPHVTITMRPKYGLRARMSKRQ